MMRKVFYFVPTMKKLVYIFAPLLLLSACKNDPRMKAMTAAEYYYNCLLDSQLGEWVDGRIYADSLTADIREERIALAREIREIMKSDRGGITAIKATHDTIVANCAFVFIQTEYADTTSEEIMVPMVLDGEVWKMK